MWLRIFAGIVVIVLVAPILVIIPISFTSSSFFQFPPPGYSLRWYNAFFENSAWVEAFRLSLSVAIITMLLSTILGTMAALAVAKLNFWGKKAFMAIMVFPMVIPAIIIAITLYHSFAPLQLTNSFLGVTLGHTLIAIPLVFVTVSASLKGVDKNLELAAMGMGSTPMGAFFKITLPLIRPGLFAGALFAFITSLDEVIVSIFLTGSNTKTLPILMWESMKSVIDPSIAVVSTFFILITIIFYLVNAWFTKLSRKNKIEI